MRSRFRRHRPAAGFALIVLLTLLMTGSLYVLVRQLDAAAVQREAEEATTLALARAKEALIGYAVSVNLVTGAARPGDLPCPDNWSLGHANSGTPGSDLVPLAAPCSTSIKRLGRLPWRTLKIPDPGGHGGEQVWYAVSANFKNNPRTGTLNADTPGTISIRDGAGNLLFDGSAASGVVAVVIAPGPPLQRQDGLVQDRTAANFNNPRHYLDNIANEDNADFNDGATDGFFQGPVRNPADPAVVIANDRIVVITQDEIMAAMEKRVAAEVINCLVGYANNPLNSGHFPWPADIVASGGGNFNDTAGTLFGRVPDLMCNTGGNGINLPCNTPPAGTAPGMLTTWGSVPDCNVTNSWFLNNWREQVFFALADAYKPAIGIPSCGTCIAVNTDSSPPILNRRAVVLVSGSALTGLQFRTTTAQKGNVANYLELENSSPLDGIFESRTRSGVFNDRVRYFPSP
jgi:hypothetical protein